MLIGIFSHLCQSIVHNTNIYLSNIRRTNLIHKSLLLPFLLKSYLWSKSVLISFLLIDRNEGDSREKKWVSMMFWLIHFLIFPDFSSKQMFLEQFSLFCCCCCWTVWISWYQLVGYKTGYFAETNFILAYDFDTLGSERFPMGRK